VAALEKKKIRASARAMGHFDERSTIAGPPSIEFYLKGMDAVKMRPALTASNCAE